MSLFPGMKLYKNLTDSECRTFVCLAIIVAAVHTRESESNKLFSMSFEDRYRSFFNNIAHVKSSEQQAILQSLFNHAAGYIYKRERQFYKVSRYTIWTGFLAHFSLPPESFEAKDATTALYFAERLQGLIGADTTPIAASLFRLERVLPFAYLSPADRVSSSLRMGCMVPLHYEPVTFSLVRSYQIHLQGRVEDETIFALACAQTGLEEQYIQTMYQDVISCLMSIQQEPDRFGPLLVSAIMLLRLLFGDEHLQQPRPPEVSFEHLKIVNAQTYSTLILASQAYLQRHQMWKRAMMMMMGDAYQLLEEPMKWTDEVKAWLQCWEPSPSTTVPYEHQQASVEQHWGKCINTTFKQPSYDGPLMSTAVTGPHATLEVDSVKPIPEDGMKSFLDLGSPTRNPLRRLKSKWSLRQRFHSGVRDVKRA